MKNDCLTLSPLFVILALSAGFSLSPRAEAADDDNLPAAVNRVERETGGQVLSAERRNQSGREMNRIKVYTPEGRVRVMWDQPRATPTQPTAPQADMRPRQITPRETGSREVRQRPPQRDHR